MIGDLGLANVRLVQANIMALDGEWGKFDYIIAHGLYSWVPAEVRERLLGICNMLLAPQGIAFVSYNAFPGNHLRNMLREMMFFHVRGIKAASEQVRQAQALARFLAEAQDAPDLYRLWMKAELETIVNHEEGHLYHDELAEISDALCFWQFMEKAAAHGLQYVGEADYFEMFDYGFSESTRKTLEQLGQNRILREQYLDFLKCRRFRQTLLCHREVSLRTEPAAEKVTGFWVSSAAKCTSGTMDLRPGATIAFGTPKGAKCATDFALGKAALGILSRAWPMPLSFGDLFQQAVSSLGDDGIKIEPPEQLRPKLAAFLLELYAAGVVEFRATLPAATAHASDRPVTSPVVRWQIQRGNVVTTAFHTVVKVEDEIGRLLLSSLDGSLDRKALLERLWLLLKSKDALIIRDGDESAARHELEHKLEGNLGTLARLGLLVS